MKFNSTIKILVLAALAAAAVLTGCKDSPPETVPDGDAGLSSLAIGGKTVTLPDAITGEIWNSGVNFNSLDETYTAKISFADSFGLNGIVIQPEAGEKAVVEYAVTTDGSSLPGEFKNITEPATLSSGDYLYIKVTAEDGTTNYYRFSIELYISVTGFSLGKNSTTLTLYSGEQLTWTITPPDAGNKKITWTSSAPSVAAVDANGKVTAAGVTASLSSNYTVTPATGTATITGKTEDGGITASITVNTTVTPQTELMTLPPLKDQFSKYFLMGNITTTSDYSNTATPTITKTSLTRHFNVLSPENVMKPSYMTNARNAATGVITYSWTNPDRFVNATIASGFKVHGHVLLWHSQNAQWMWDQIASKTGTIASGMTKTAAITIMNKYITEVTEHYKGKIYSWDVLNEAFPDNASSSANWKDAIRKNAGGEGQDANPWYIAIGPDFVYEGYLAARKADPAAILYYNDYNTDNSNRARLIRDMVKEVNDKYLASGDKPAGEAPGRLLIEGIGMQEHHNTGVATASIRATINLFRPLGVKISVSELDVLAQSYSQYSSNPATGNNSTTAANNTVTNQGLLDHARLYGEYMKLYLDNADIIERVTFWGVTDNQSWRAKGLPLPFDPSGKAKPSYYKVIDALNQMN